MTSHGTRRWIQVVGRTTDPSESVASELVQGPCTVLRILWSVSAWCDGPVFFGFWRYGWGLSVGDVSADPVDPNAGDPDWMIWQAVQIPDRGTGDATNGPADTAVDSEGARTLHAASSLWFAASTFPNGPDWHWQWQGRVLVYEPE